MILVDTSVWSLALRRHAPPSTREVERLKAAIAAGEQLFTTGLILQELLQGFSGPQSADRIIIRFAALPFLVPNRQDHIAAASLRNHCRRAGVQVGTIDALLAQLCLRHGLSILTADQDFQHMSRHCELKLT